MTVSVTSHLSAIPVDVDAIVTLRAEYRREMACQIVHDSWHRRGFTQSYLLQWDGEIVGYGSVGGVRPEARNIVKEFFVRPASRGMALLLFRALVDASGAAVVEAQTNDRLLLLMLYDCATDITTDTILFADDATTHHPAPPGIALRRVEDAERKTVFDYTIEPVGDWGLECGGALVATGGILTHYNPPYGDIYMEVSSLHQRKGLGSYLVQELKRICREDGRIPAARCHQDNAASRRTLQHAGMFPCARILHGSFTGVSDDSGQQSRPTDSSSFRAASGATISYSLAGSAAMCRWSYR
jgi:GNAT superfamily N-acetyltransferase